MIAIEVVESLSFISYRGRSFISHVYSPQRHYYGSEAESLNHCFQWLLTCHCWVHCRYVVFGFGQFLSGKKKNKNKMKEKNKKMEEKIKMNFNINKLLPLMLASSYKRVRRGG